MRHTRPSFAASTTKMFPRGLLLMLLSYILYCRCYVEATEGTSAASKKAKTTMSDSMIISTAMVCTMFSVLIVMVPTVLYYRYCSKTKINE